MSTVADPEGALVGKLSDHLPRLGERFETMSVAVTPETHPRVLDLLRSSRAHCVAGTSDLDAIGRDRRAAVALALESGSAPYMLYADLDHVLRWVENDPQELDEVIEEIATSDCTVIGRGPLSMAQTPRRLAATEGIVNQIFALLTGNHWDVLMAARGLSRLAAKAIVSDCQVDTVGNDCAWPLFCRSRGLTLHYFEAEGLTYQTNQDYAHDLPDSLDSDPQAWAFRVRIAAQQVDAMIPFMRASA